MNMTQITIEQAEKAMAYASRVTGVAMTLSKADGRYTLSQGTPNGISRHMLTGSKSEIYYALHMEAMEASTT